MLRLVLFLLTAVAALPAGAQSVVQNPHTRIELIADGAATLAIVMTPADGWHIYWQNPGGAGLETQAKWTLPAGVSASPIRYPVPKTFLVAGIMNYVFEGETALLVELDGVTPATTGPIRVRLNYLVCDDMICVPEAADLKLDFKSAVPDAERFDRARAALPKRVDWPARFERSGGRLRIAVPLAQPETVTGAYFFPYADGVLDYDAPQSVGLDDDTLIIETRAGHDKALKSIGGVLKLTRAESDLGAVIEAKAGAVPRGGSPLAADTAPSVPSAPPALLFAILGGLLLNIMPCVFPILGLKALSLARGGAAAHARREALAYTGGVMLTCLALGGLILALRAAGTEIGWAFQLQDPRIILVLLLLITAIALNLAGLFEITPPRVGGDALAGRAGSAGAFWTGALAAVVATPCTGPFMGIALGAAILLPPATGLLIFAGLGFGLALPFLAIGFIPALRGRLPKPGAWLVTFRHLMAVPMFATALALAWVLGRQSGTGGLTLGLGAALLLGSGLWWLGLRQRGGRSIWLPLAVTAASLAATPAIPLHARQVMPVTATLPNTEAFSESRLAALRAAGTPVFVYFTADWCITCKVNEQGVLASDAVARAFADAGVVTLVGDWTNADPAITRFLAGHGRAGVPLYLFYGAEGLNVLPQLLDAEGLVALVS